MKTRVTLPLLSDRHNHPSLYAALRGALSLAGLATSDAIERISVLPRASLSLVLGWRDDLVPRAAFYREDLPPALIVNWSLHGFALTPLARPRVEAAWPELAERADDDAWKERELPRILAFFGRVGGLDGAKLGAYFRGLRAAGFGAAEDLAVTGKEALREILASAFHDRIAVWAPLDLLRSLDPAERSACAGAKLFLDGALGARTAALDAPFADFPEGRLVHEDDALDEALAEIAALGARPAVHAIGHRAIEQIIAALERLDRSGLTFEGARVEHAQFVSEDQARRARDLGCILSMQPIFSLESRDYADRLVVRHRGENNPFRALIDRVGFRPGVDLLFGTDGMPADVARTLEAGLFPPRETQRLSLDELVAGFGEAPCGGVVEYEIDDERETVSRVGET